MYCCYHPIILISSMQEVEEEFLQEKLPELLEVTMVNWWLKQSLPLC